jgi:hypothetical protein
VQGFDEDLKKAKEARSALRKNKKGVKDGERVAMPRRGSSVSSIGSGVLGAKEERRGVLGSMHIKRPGEDRPSAGRSVSSGEVKRVLREQEQQEAEGGGDGDGEGEGSGVQNGDAQHAKDESQSRGGTSNQQTS